jgi:hypothetical protein
MKKNESAVEGNVWSWMIQQKKAIKRNDKKAYL